MLAGINLDEINSIEVTSKQSYDSLQSELGTLNGAVSSSKRLLDKLNKLGDHCPTCEQDIDAEFKQSLIDAEARKIAEAREKQDEIDREISKIKQNNSLFDKKEKATKRSRKIYIEI